VRTSRLSSLGVVACVAALIGVLPTSASAASGLTGAGSSMVAPLIAEWSAAFEAFHAAPVTYDPAGAQTGVTDITARTVDFAASEAPMSTAQRTACNGCFQIPCALSALGIGYHVNGLRSALYLSGKVLAQIYLGQITRWNDGRIKALNGRASLPNLRIAPIYSVDSGSTYTFTRYLSKVSTTWRQRVGYGPTVSFPTGVAENSNAAAALLASTNGTIAYLGAAYLIAHALPAAAIENSAGRFEYPNLSEIESAGRTVKLPPTSNGLEIVDPPRSARIAYPIAAFTYMVFPANAPQRSLLSQWISYVLGAGQTFGRSLDYAPLPSNVLRASKAAVSGFTGSP
jgi:phosphate transport system substrate-binding protein